MPPYPARSGSLLVLGLILDSGINKKRLDGLSQSRNTLFRYIVFFFKVISGIRYQTFYKSGSHSPPPSPSLCAPGLKIGTLRSNDADGNENVKKPIGLISKQQLCTCITLFCTFLCSFLHDYEVDMFYGVRKQATAKFYFSFCTWIWS